MYAIAGASGHVGSVAAETLLAQGKQVRVIVRDAGKAAGLAAKGAEVVVGAFDDQAFVVKALTGVQGAFLLLPPSRTSPAPLEDHAALSALFARAIQAARLPHAVLLSSFGAQHPGGTGPIRAVHRAELDLAATGAAITAVRPSSFYENWANSLGALGQGILPSFVPADLRYAQVATHDIGKTVAAALVEGGTPGTVQVIELTGPRDYSPADVAAELSKLTGKPIAVHELPLDAVAPTLIGVGFPAVAAELYREMYAGLVSGHVGFERGAARQVRGSVEIGETLKALLAATT
jgi:uncharacterized protein YbjT (DUF2867 family)